MTLVYFDSSALVKLVVDEQGSDLAAALWNGCDAPVSSSLAHPEVCAALAAAGRAHRLDSADQQQAEAAWGSHWAAVRTVPLTPVLALHAGSLAGRHALGGADAVHLASLLTVGTAAVCAVWDRRLWDGARAEGFTVTSARA